MCIPSFLTAVDEIFLMNAVFKLQILIITESYITSLFTIINTCFVSLNTIIKTDKKLSTHWIILPLHKSTITL